MAGNDEGLVGAWRKVGSEACALGYAALLRVDANGLYFGESGQPGQFTWWDGGTWEVRAPGKLALAIANDAVVTYDYALDGDLLTITDAQGCRFRYRRER